MSRRAVLGGAAAAVVGGGGLVALLTGDDGGGAPERGGRRPDGDATSPPTSTGDRPREPAEEPSVADVREFGATGDGRTDDSAAFLRALASGREAVVVPAGTYLLSQELDVPWSVKRLDLEEASLLRQSADLPVIRRKGTIDPEPLPVSDAVEGRSTVLIDGSARLQPGQWLYLCSDDWVKVGKSMRGTLRRVEAVQGATVTLDRPLIASLVAGARGHRVELAPPLLVTGRGAAEFIDPVGTNNNIIRFDFTADPRVEHVELRNSGGSAVRLYATVGGIVDCWIHDTIDDEEAGHYAYGVSASSAARDLVVRGTIERVRHAFTTEHGWGPILRSIARTGEPEEILVEPKVRETSSTGIDTHEVGCNITIVPDITAAGSMKWGGINVRARNVTVKGGHVTGSREWGIQVQSPAEGTVIDGTVVDGVAAGNGINCQAPTEIRGARVSGFGPRFGIMVPRDVPVRVEGGRIDGGGDPKSRGIGLAGSGGTLRTTVANCAIGLQRIEPESGNVVDVRYENCGRDEN